MEARDASGRVIGKNHAEIITPTLWLVALLALTAVAGLLLILAGQAVQPGWLFITLPAAGSLLEVVALGFIGFALWGLYVGYGFHFTP